MNYSFDVTEEANEEAFDAYSYYEEKQEGLGERFLATLEDCYKNIRLNPQYYSFISSKKVKTMRDIKIEDFPYVVIYNFKDNKITVYSVHNTNKKSKF